MPIRSMTHYMTCWWLKYEYAWQVSDDTHSRFKEAYSGRCLEVPCGVEDAVDIRRRTGVAFKIDEVLDDGFDAVQMACAT